MYAQQQAVHEAVNALKKAIGKGFIVSFDMLETPPDQKLGDLAFPCFDLARGQGRNPVEIATELAAKIGPTDLISKITSAGPYVNFTFAASFSAQVVQEVLKQKKTYGQSQLGKGLNVLVEYAQPNTHKEVHIGHVRNFFLGQSVVNVLEANGYDVVPTCYIGDWGGDVAKAVWGFNMYVGEEEVPVEERSARLQETYTKASQQVKDDEAAREEVSGVLAAIEGKEEPWAGIYKKTRQWSLDEFKSVFAEMKVRPVKWYFESEVDKEARDLVHSMLTDGVAKKSEGAVVVEFEDDTLPTFLILKSDGTAVYSTWDLVLAQKKEKDFAPDRQLIITDNRQDLHFRQVFATLKKLGFQKVMHHLSYDIVALPDGAMSSRAGRIVTYKDVRDEWVQELTKQTQERHEDWSEKQVAATAKTLALGALAFMMLRQDANSIIKYDAKEAMSFDGFTAPYLLYTVARIHSLEKKVKTKVPKQLTLEHPVEQRLARKLALYPSVVEKAGKTYNVAQIATWAFELAKMFSEYYHEVRIAEDEDKVRKASRMALMKAVRQGLTNALTLLGIDTLEEM